MPRTVGKRPRLKCERGAVCLPIMAITRYGVPHGRDARRGPAITASRPLRSLTGFRNFTIILVPVTGAVTVRKYGNTPLPFAVAKLHCYFAPVCMEND